MQPRDPTPPPSDETPAPSSNDAALEALLREQQLLALPLALVGRILHEVLPPQQIRPLALFARSAAAVLVFFASWLAFSGNTLAMADMAPAPRVAAALPSGLPSGLPAGVSVRLPAGPKAIAARADGEPSQDGLALLFLGGGALVLAAGLVLILRMHRSAVAGPTKAGRSA